MDVVLPDDLLKLYCVYLLLSENKKYKGKIYIGFTVDPNRRLKQHNAGIYHGGASKTNNKGPWEMLLVVYGFPHEISALRFEWAWQNPHLSRRLKDIKNKTSVESHLKFHLRVLDGMLQTEPWKRLPLKVQLLKSNIMADIRCCSYLHHISDLNEYFDTSSKKNVIPIEKETSLMKGHPVLCFSCGLDIGSSIYMVCLNSTCQKIFHINCLANYFLENEDEVIPNKGRCPSCNNDMLWCDLITYNKLVL